MVEGFGVADSETVGGEGESARGGSLETERLLLTLDIVRQIRCTTVGGIVSKVEKMTWSCHQLPGGLVRRGGSNSQ